VTQTKPLTSANIKLHDFNLTVEGVLEEPWLWHISLTGPDGSLPFRFWTEEAILWDAKEVSDFLWSHTRGIIEKYSPVFFSNGSVEVESEEFEEQD
jgi:hypothetical protein